MRAPVHLSVCLRAGGGKGKESARWLFTGTAVPTSCTDGCPVFSATLHRHAGGSRPFSSWKNKGFEESEEQPGLQ